MPFRNYLIKPLSVAAFFMLFVLLAWAGGDPWKDKPYQQWNQQDVSKILTNSPWAKVVRVTASWRAGGPESQPQSPPAGQSQPAPPTPYPGIGQRTNPSSPGQSDSGEQGPPQPTQAAFLVRWNSARTVRQAISRSAMLNGQLQATQAERLLAQPVPDYEILITGPDMTPFASATEAALKSEAYLMLKSSKEKVAPEKVEIAHGTEGKITAVAFSFAKKTASGEPVISDHEKGVDFVLALSDMSLHSSFDPQKMSTKEGRDM